MLVIGGGGCGTSYGCGFLADLMRTVYLDGDFLPLAAAKVSVLDRGFLLGDGVYEVIPVFAGSCFELTAHLARLTASLAAVRMENPLDDVGWRAILSTLIAKNNSGDQALYLQVTRGVSPRDHAFPNGVSPTVFVMSNPLNSVPESYKTVGIKAITLEDTRWKNCHIKAISLLPNSLLRQQAVDVGAQEAILLRDGHVTEGAASNVFIVLNGRVITPPKNHEILAGITRDVIFVLTKKAGIPIEERQVTETELRAADEVWVSSSTKEILPITQLDGETVGNGQVGRIWQQVNNLYQQHKRTGSSVI